MIPTEKGLFLYELVKDRAIAKVELTGKWEQKLEEMRANKVSYEVFMKHIKDFTHRITKELLQLKIHLPKESTASKQTLSIACPKCKKGFVQLNEKIGQCTLYARGCDFRIWRTLFGVFLEEVEIKRLLEEGRSSKFDKLFDKNENRYRKGHLILKDLRIQIQESS